MIITNTMIMLAETVNVAPATLVRKLQEVGFPAVRAAKVGAVTPRDFVGAQPSVIIETSLLGTAHLAGKVMAVRPTADDEWQVTFGHVGIAVPKPYFVPKWKELGRRLRIWQQAHEMITFCGANATTDTPYGWRSKLLDQPLEDGMLPLEWVLHDLPSRQDTEPYRLWRVESLPSSGKFKRVSIMSYEEYRHRLDQDDIG